MKEFVLLFRQPDTDNSQMTDAKIQGWLKKWDDWFGGVAAQGSLVNMGMRLGNEGNVLKAGGLITDGPFVEIRERLNGFILVRADNLDDATTLAHGCPILEIQGTVEIRPRIPVNFQNPVLNESRFTI